LSLPDPNRGRPARFTEHCVGSFVRANPELAVAVLTARIVKSAEEVLAVVGCPLV
jgi:hypothetical protein